MQQLIVDTESADKARELQSVLADLRFVKGIRGLDTGPDTESDFLTRAAMTLPQASLAEDWDAERGAHWDSFKAI